MRMRQVPSKRILKLNDASQSTLPPIKDALPPESRDEMAETTQAEGGELVEGLPSIDQPYRDEAMRSRLDDPIPEAADASRSSAGSRISETRRKLHKVEDVKPVPV